MQRLNPCSSYKIFPNNFQVSRTTLVFYRAPRNANCIDTTSTKYSLVATKRVQGVHKMQLHSVDIIPGHLGKASILSLKNNLIKDESSFPIAVCSLRSFYSTYFVATNQHFMRTDTVAAIFTFFSPPHCHVWGSVDLKLQNAAK